MMLSAPCSSSRTAYVFILSDFKFTHGLKLIEFFAFQYGGINVDVRVSEGGVYITFTAYHPGDAPALVINHTDQAVRFWEKGNVNERILKPYEKMLYTWQDPAGERKILWTGDDDEAVENDLRRDGIGKPITSAGGDKSLYWVSFLDGTQRVLLFTNVENIAVEANSANRLDKVCVQQMHIHTAWHIHLRFISF